MVLSLLRHEVHGLTTQPVAVISVALVDHLHEAPFTAVVERHGGVIWKALHHIRCKYEVPNANITELHGVSLLSPASSVVVVLKKTSVVDNVGIGVVRVKRSVDDGLLKQESNHYMNKIA